MRIPLLILLFLILFQSNAQNDTLPKTIDSNNPQVKPYTEKLPAFVNGGDEGFNKFIKENIIIPSGPKKSGTVYIRFIVETDGSISNVEVLKGKGLSKSYDQAAIDVVSKSPKWSPGEQNGELRRVRIIRKINF